jgi:hypothetical protein
MELLGLKLSVYQCWLLASCPVAGLLGSTVRVLMIRNTLEDLPDYPADPKPLTFAYFYVRLNWYFGWSVVGIATGLLAGLLFLSELAESVGAVGRVVAVALLAGYGAPALWKKQQDFIFSMIEQRLKASSSVGIPPGAAATNNGVTTKPGT